MTAVMLFGLACLVLGLYIGTRASNGRTPNNEFWQGCGCALVVAGLVLFLGCFVASMGMLS